MCRACCVCVGAGWAGRGFVKEPYTLKPWGFRQGMGDGRPPVRNGVLACPGERAGVGSSGGWGGVGGLPPA